MYSILNKELEEIKCSDPIKKAIDLLNNNKILCIKGAGGYNLICKLDEETINRLRKRKKRPKKPLVVMMKNINIVKKYCFLSNKEEKELLSDESPIVILEKKQKMLDNISFNSSIGVILPYIDIHKRITEEIDCLIFTSGNISTFPIIHKDEDIIKLKNVCDYYLISKNTIDISIDDSLVKYQNNNIRVLRPGRGYYPLTLNNKVNKNILSIGSLMKNTFCIGLDNNIYMSHYLGDIENISCEKRMTNVLDYVKKEYDYKIDTLVYDLHPYMNKLDFIKNFKGKKIEIYHHHAHIVSCMAENNYFNNVIGIAFDGLGYGEDNALLGGEFLICNLKTYKRVMSLEKFSLPGGDDAVLNPWKIGVSLLDKFLGIKDFFNTDDEKIVLKMLSKNINSPLTSSMGRLFDGVASILGFRESIGYEGEAAIYLEEIAKKADDTSYYNYNIKDYIEIKNIIKEILEDINNGVSFFNIARKFHNTIIRFSTEVCISIRNETGLKTVALSGGVFQNTILLEGIENSLKNVGFNVLTHKIVPTNDSGISLGQIFIADKLESF